MTRADSRKWRKVALQVVAGGIESSALGGRDRLGHLRKIPRNSESFFSSTISVRSVRSRTNSVDRFALIGFKNFQALFVCCMLGAAAPFNSTLGTQVVCCVRDAAALLKKHLGNTGQRSKKSQLCCDLRWTMTRRHSQQESGLFAPRPSSASDQHFQISNIAKG